MAMRQISQIFLLSSAFFEFCSISYAGKNCIEDYHNLAVSDPAAPRLIQFGKYDPEFPNEVARRLKLPGYQKMLSGLDQAAAEPSRFEVEFQLDEAHLVAKGLMLNRGSSHLRGRVLDINRRFISPQIEIELNGQEKFQISLTDIAEGSFKLSEKPLLRIPLAPNTSLPSQIAKQDGIDYLIHATSIAKLEGIVKSNVILPADQLQATSVVQGRGDVIYLEALGKSRQGAPFKTDQYARKWAIKLIFAPALLDGEKFHISRGWLYGQVAEESAHHNEFNKLHQILWDISHGYQNANELVFPNPIGLKHLRAIWVEPQDREPVIAILRKLHFQPPIGLSIEKFVVEQKTWP